jgi:hypothetical protein
MVLFLVELFLISNLPFCEDKIEALRLAHMPYAKQSFYKKTYPLHQQDRPWQKYHHHCDPNKLLCNPW